ncbi:E3 ubiquitin/ISG15 ligase TRIM25-like isoform 2-T2 [Pholidichthys leucotaenia]
MEDVQEARLEAMLMCPVCQDTFRDPRQLSCGHSLCLACLEGLMDHTSQVPFRCPDCRTDFGQVVGVQKNYALAHIAEDFRANRSRREKQTRPVYCDICLDKNTPAFQTCLKCEVSLCRQHASDHLNLPVFTGHPLVSPLGDLQERRCPQHEDRVLRYFCTSSRRYICNLCALEGRQLSTATDASTVLRRQLTEQMDQCFTTINEQITEATNTLKKMRNDIQHEKEKLNPANSKLSGVTVVLLFLWFIVLYYAYNYSVENQALTEALHKQQELVHQIHPTAADPLVHHPENHHKPEEAEDQVTTPGNLFCKDKDMKELK